MTGAVSDDIERVIALRDAWRELSFALVRLLTACREAPGRWMEDAVVARACERVNAAYAALRALGVEPFEPRDQGELVAGDAAAAGLVQVEQLVASDAAAAGLDEGEQRVASDVEARAASASSSAAATSRSSSTPFGGRDRGELPGVLERQ